MLNWMSRFHDSAIGHNDKKKKNSNLDDRSAKERDHMTHQRAGKTVLTHHQSTVLSSLPNLPALTLFFLLLLYLQPPCCQPASFTPFAASLQWLMGSYLYVFLKQSAIVNILLQNQQPNPSWAARGCEGREGHFNAGIKLQDISVRLDGHHVRSGVNGGINSCHILARREATLHVWCSVLQDAARRWRRANKNLFIF